MSTRIVTTLGAITLLTIGLGAALAASQASAQPVPPPNQQAVIATFPGICALNPAHCAAPTPDPTPAPTTPPFIIIDPCLLPGAVCVPPPTPEPPLE